MQDAFRRFIKWIRYFISTNAFFHISVAIFALGAIWVATTSLYPMAFDEDFHLGLIKIYAQHILPFGIENTKDMAAYGAATRDPSYLFHYLMSFPYRLLASAGMSQAGTVVMLRLIDVAMVVGALYLYRLTLKTFSLSNRVANVSLAFFMLIPVLPLLAGQINYDNLLLLETSLAIYLLAQISMIMLATRKVPIILLGLLLITCLVTAATKYAFLPLALGMVLYLFGLLIYLYFKNGKWLLASILNSMRRTKKAHLFLLVIAIFCALFLNTKYVTNGIHYQTITPSCNQVFERSDCLSFGPYGRDEAYKQLLPGDFSAKSYPEYFVEDWIPGMTNRLFFTLSGSTNDFTTRDPLPVPIVVYSLLTLFGFGTFLYFRRSILRNNAVWWMAISMTLAYAVPLSVTLYQSYAATGQPVAINGRYLLPLLPLLAALLIVSMQKLRFVSRHFKIAPAIVLVVILVVALEGGGIATYIVRGETNWFYKGWGQSSHTVFKDILKPITID